MINTERYIAAAKIMYEELGITYDDLKNLSEMSKILASLPVCREERRQRRLPRSADELIRDLRIAWAELCRSAPPMVLGMLNQERFAAMNDAVYTHTSEEFARLQSEQGACP